MAEGLDVEVLDNSTGQPISGLNVGCTQSGTGYYGSKTTGSDGKVRFEGLTVPGGFVSVVVNQGGYLGYEQKRVDGITIYEGQYTQRTVKLSPDGTTPPPPPPPNGDDPQNYVVTVNDTAARPIEGATVEGRWRDMTPEGHSHTFSVVTNAQGKAQVFREPPSNVDYWTILLIAAEGYASFAASTDIPPEQHTYQRNLFPESQEGEGVVLAVDPRVQEISPGQTIEIYAEIKNQGKADNIKIVWGLFQPSPFVAIQTREVVKNCAEGEVFQVDESFTLPADYDKATVLVLAAGYHEE